jgi:hypothetical protein
MYCYRLQIKMVLKKLVMNRHEQLVYGDRKVWIFVRELHYDAESIHTIQSRRITNRNGYGSRQSWPTQVLIRGAASSSSHPWSCLLKFSSVELPPQVRIRGAASSSAHPWSCLLKFSSVELPQVLIRGAASSSAHPWSCMHWPENSLQILVRKVDVLAWVIQVMKLITDDGLVRGRTSELIIMLDSEVAVTRTFPKLGDC